MKVLITTPAPPRSRYGNRVTALRWARILKELGHQVTVSQAYEDGDYDLLVALHARRSHPSVDRWRRLHPNKPLVVALSGTDLYLHVGGAMNDAMAARARAEMKVNPRYLWLGEQPRWRTRSILTRSHLCVLSSRLEGGANVLSESIVASVPVVASRIPGTVGILGEDYPGYFTVGGTRELRRLLIRAETDPDFLSLLRSKCDELAGLFEPAREQRAWKDLLGELR